MGTSLRIPVDGPSQVAEARRAVVVMAQDLGFDEVRAGQTAIVATEACTNILKHAGRGEILLRVSDMALELLALDRGPGMRNLEQCLRDGYTTGSSYGQGLGAIQRLSDESDFYSVPAEGTAILARWAVAKPAGKFPAATEFRVGAVSVPKHGQDVCGDTWGIETSGDTATLMVADGLGHGLEAGQASTEAVRVLRSNPDRAPKSIVELSHLALRSLRGAAVAVARIDPEQGKLNFCGVGNIMAQIYNGGQRSQHLVSVNGTAGHHSASVREFSYAWPASAGMLMMHSDGLATGTSLDGRAALVSRDPALIAGVLYRDFSRGHDDATIVILKAA